MADVKFSEFDAAITVVGDEEVVGLQGADNIRIPIDMLRQILGLPKVYKAYMTQGGTSNPGTTLVKNSLSGAPAFARTGVGTFTITLAGAFTVGKTFVNGLQRLLPIAAEDRQIYFVLTSINVITFTTFQGGVAADGVIDAAIDLSIEVYP